MESSSPATAARPKTSGTTLGPLTLPTVPVSTHELTVRWTRADDCSLNRILGYFRLNTPNCEVNEFLMPIEVEAGQHAVPPLDRWNGLGIPWDHTLDPTKSIIMLVRPHPLRPAQSLCHQSHGQCFGSPLWLPCPVHRPDNQADPGAHPSNRPHIQDRHACLRNGATDGALERAAGRNSSASPPGRHERSEIAPTSGYAGHRGGKPMRDGRVADPLVPRPRCASWPIGGPRGRSAGRLMTSSSSLRP